MFRYYFYISAKIISILKRRGMLSKTFRFHAFLFLRSRKQGETLIIQLTGNYYMLSNSFLSLMKHV